MSQATPPVTERATRTKPSASRRPKSALARRQGPRDGDLATVFVDTADHISKDGNTVKVDHSDVAQIQKHCGLFDRGR
jgi:hypothetical protein